MDDRIKVHLVKYPDRANFVMRYRDPDSGKQIARSTGTNNERKAQKAAGVWEDELRAGRYQKPQQFTWADFRQQFGDSVLVGLKPTTAATYDATLNVFERLTPTEKLAGVTTARLTTFVSDLRKSNCQPATIARHLRALKDAGRIGRDCCSSSHSSTCPSKPKA